MVRISQGGCQAKNGALKGTLFRQILFQGSLVHGALIKFSYLISFFSPYPWIFYIASIALTVTVLNAIEKGDVKRGRGDLPTT